MRIGVILRTAIKALATNRRRSILTMIGIVIGIASVIAIISIGKGFQKKTIDSMNASGDNVVTTITFSPTDSSMDFSNTDIYAESDIRLAERVKGVSKAYIDKSYQEDEDTGTFQTSLNGSTQSLGYQLFTDDAPKALKGRTLTDDDNMMKHKVVVIDTHVAKKIASSNENALNRGININGEVFTVVGVYKATGMLSDNSNAAIYIPKKTYKKYLYKKQAETMLSLKISGDAKPSVVTNNVVEVLQNSGSMRHVGQYQYMDLSGLVDTLSDVLGGITYFISAVAGISLFIAGVGIMNMMYISVSERTKEIGIRRALGAKKRDILLQFLLEGILITLIGGLIGFLGGVLMAQIIGLAIKVPPVVDAFSIMLTVGISVGIGLVFSVMPARAATQKDLIDIMK